MKLYYIPLKEKSTPYYSYFTPEYYFETQWSVGMRGLIGKEELKGYIDELNKIVKDNSLLSVKRLWGAFCAFLLCSALIVIITILVFFGSLSKFVVGIALNPFGLLDITAHYVIGPIVAEMVLAIFLFFTILVIINEAKTRTSKFTIEIERKLYEYNKRNLNVYYKLKWRKGIFTHYDIELGCDINNENVIFREKVPPMFGENAEIEIEINDEQILQRV